MTATTVLADPDKVVMPDQMRIVQPRTRSHRRRVSRPSLIGRSGIMPWAPVWMSCGIGGWLLLPFQPGWQVYAMLWAVVGVVAMAAWFARRHEGTRSGWQLVMTLQLLLVIGVAVAAGFSLTGLRSERMAAPILQFRYYGPVEGRLVQIDRSARDRLRLTLADVVMRDMAASRTPSRVRLSLMLPEDAEPDLPKAGTRIMLTGHLGPPPGPAEPGGFDFRRFAWFEGLGAVGYSRTPIMTVAPAAPGGQQLLTRLRMKLSAAIQDRIPGQAGAVASAITTGDRSGILDATNEAMRDANLYHIVSISGLHMSLLAGFLYNILRLGIVAVQATGVGVAMPAHKLAAVGALAGAAGYLALSGGGSATERAFVMVAVMLVAILVDRRAISLRTVALAAMALLAYAPETLSNAGFQMSFAATVALIVVNDYTKGLGRHWPKWFQALLMTALTTVIAGFATGPIAAAQFNRISHYGLLANMAAVPVVGFLVMPAAVLAALLGPLGLAGPALWAVGLGVEWMLMVAEWTAGLKGSASMASTPPNAVLPLLGAGGAIMALTPWKRLVEQKQCPLPARIPKRGWAGLTLLVLAGVLWLTMQRPVLLIAPEGEAVALLTPAGRVPSKSRGGAFVVARWLESDGDGASQAEAAERRAWQGPANARSAGLPWGGEVHHYTGKDAELRAAAACRAGVMVVLDRAAPEGLSGCEVIDLPRLRRTGALRFDAQGRMTATRQVSGRRPWVEP